MTAPLLPVARLHLPRQQSSIGVGSTVLGFAITEFALVHNEVWLGRYHVLGKRPLCG